METIGTWWMWTGFAAFVVVAIAVDLLLLEKRGAAKVSMKEAALLERPVVFTGLCVCGGTVVVPRRRAPPCLWCW